MSTLVGKSPNQVASISQLGKLAHQDSDAPFFGALKTLQAAPTVASATTIAPVSLVSFISGTVTIETITPPHSILETGGQLTLIPTGLFLTNTSGNIALASVAVVNKTLIMTWDATAAKWYPSY
jgi:hypothetical protein